MATIYVALAVAAVTLVPAARKAARVAAVELKFVEKVVNEPPPPPPQVVDLKPEASAAAALPSSGRSKKVRRLEKPPPPREMVAPKAMPQEAPREADPSEDKGVAVSGEDGKRDPAGLEGGVAQGGVVGGQRGDELIIRGVGGRSCEVALRPHLNFGPEVGTEVALPGASP